MGYADVSAAFSESGTQGFDNETGPFAVGGSGGNKWLPLALVLIAAFGLWLWYSN